MSAGIETLSLLREPGVYERLESLGGRLEDGLNRLAASTEERLFVTRAGSVLTLFFTRGPVTDFTSAATSDRDRFAVYFHKMLDQGIYLPPSQFEAMFVSLAHGDEEIERTIEAAAVALGA